MPSLELYLLGLAGIAIHYLKTWVNANNKGEQFNLKRAIPNASLSVITTLLLVYVRKDIENIYVVTPIGAAILGYLGNSTFFSIVEARKPKIGSQTTITEKETPDTVTTQIQSTETKPKE